MDTGDVCVTERDDDDDDDDDGNEDDDDNMTVDMMTGIRRRSGRDGCR